MPLEENRQFKKHYQSFCSGCTRRGHFVHTCRITIPFSGLPINSPYVAVYRPVYSPMWNNNLTPNNQHQGNKQYIRCTPHDPNVPSLITPTNDCLKRQSKSPVNHDTHVNKKKNLGPTDTEVRQSTMSPINSNNSINKKNSLNKEQPTTNKDATEDNKTATIVAVEESQACDKAPDFIPISSENHDKSGQIIQDNEVSDTSDVVTSARIYILKEVADKLKTEKGDIWLKEAIKNNNVTLQSDNINFYLSIKGTVGNQEAFQTELRQWIGVKQSKEQTVSENEGRITQESNTEHRAMSINIPKNRNHVLRKLNKAFESLNTNLGDPMVRYKELKYLQNQHQQLLNQKVVSPQQLANSRSSINGMFRKLNMILLGQAGLADGSRHLSDLHLLQEKVSNFRQKIIPKALREKIGEHYHCIFEAVPRDDYVELINMYCKSGPLKKRCNNKISIRPANNIHNMYVQKLLQNVKNKYDDTQNDNAVTPFMTKAKSKLLFYQRRLLHSNPTDVTLKKTKFDLITKLNTQIKAIEKSHTNKNNVKKIREQVQLFLSNM